MAHAFSGLSSGTPTSGGSTIDTGGTVPSTTTPTTPTSGGGGSFVPQDQNDLNTQLSNLNGLVYQNYDTFLAEYNANAAQIEADRDASQAKLDSLYDDVLAGYAENRLNATELLSPMREAFGNEITRMSNAYNNQAAREAERVDALIASGALGGNAYRAYQAHTQTNRDLMGQALGQIAGITIQAEDSLMKAGIAIGQSNQQLFSATMQTLGAIAGKMADSALGFSQLLSQNVLGAEAALQNLMQINLGIMQEQDKLFLANRQMDIDLEIANLQSQTSIDIAGIQSRTAITVANINNRRTPFSSPILSLDVFGVRQVGQESGFIEQGRRTVTQTTRSGF